MPVTEISAAPVAVSPVSILQEHEQELADGVYQFALETIAPRALEMDRANVMDPGLVKKFFELDLMGIEIPEEYGGLGLNFTTSIAIIEALARVDAACAVVVDVQNQTYTALAYSGIDSATGKPIYTVTSGALNEGKQYTTQDVRSRYQLKWGARLTF